MSEPDHVEFERRVVPDDADHEYAFWGSYTYDDDTGRVHTVERLFKIRAAPDRRGEDGAPVAVIEETHLAATGPDADSRAGDAEQVDEATYEEVIDVDTEYEEEYVMEWCEDWHRSHLGQPPESSARGQNR